MTPSNDLRLNQVLAEQVYPLLFTTLSGSHLYGFASSDSDVDLRGVHILPARQLLGLDCYEDTVSTMMMPDDGLTVDLVTHDLGHFLRLLLKHNGNALETLYSPLVLRTSPVHQELKELARGCITTQCGEHYRGYALNQWFQLQEMEPRRVKVLLYVYRVFLTGLYLIETGRIEANLLILNERYRLDFLAELIAQRQENRYQTLTTADLQSHTQEVQRLTEQLKAAQLSSSLPVDLDPQVKAGFNDLLVRVRLGTL